MLDAGTVTLTGIEVIDLIQAQPERTCVPVVGVPVCKEDQSEGEPVKMKARGGAIIMTSDDWGRKKTELEQACRMLGKNCSFEKVSP